jgi:hypothetical protein
MDGGKATTKADPVVRALADVRRVHTRLIKLLGHEDGAVGQRAAAVLAVIDPPPITPLTDVLIQTRDKRLRLRIIVVLGLIAEVEQVRVVVALGSAYLAVKDPDVRLAIVQTIMNMKMYRELAAQAAGASPATPGGDPPQGASGPGEDDGTEDGLPAGRRQRPRRGL